MIRRNYWLSARFSEEPIDESVNEEWFGSDELQFIHEDYVERFSPELSDAKLAKLYLHKCPAHVAKTLNAACAWGLHVGIYVRTSLQECRCVGSFCGSVRLGKLKYDHQV